MPFLVAIAVLAAAAGVTEAAGTVPYTIQPEAGARFRLEVHKTGLMSGKVHVFEYERYSGRLDFEAAAPGNSRVEFSMEAASIVCKDAWIGANDVGKVTRLALEMMEYEKHPRLHFQSTQITPRPDGSFEVIGNLTIKGISRPARITARMKVEGPALTFTGTAIVLRRSYGIKPPTPLPFGVIGNKEEMPVSFTLIARPERP